MVCGLGTGEMSMLRTAFVVLGALSVCGFSGTSSLNVIHVETVASVGMCNAVRLDVRLKGNGDLVVNDETTNLRGLQAAAMRKDDACRDAPALVSYDYAHAASNDKKNEVRYWLTHIVQNISLKERLR